MRKLFIFTPALAALVLATAGCGSSKSTTTTGTATAAASGTTSSSSAGGGAYSGGAYSGGSSAASGSGAAPSTSGGVQVTTKSSKLGTILAAGPKKMTVYLFEADKGSTSACSGACATAWPPVKAAAAPRVGGGAMGVHLGTITRSDGTKQVTYNGHPLYYFVQDKDESDAYGQGVNAFGAGWYVLAPSGNKIDHS